MKRRRLLPWPAHRRALHGWSRPTPSGRMPRVGFLMAGDPEPMWTLFRKAMADLGYIEDRTIKYEYRVAFAGRASCP